MQRYPVQSSNLASVGYDEEKQFLEIAFKNGAVYQYANVPYAIYKGLMNASSHGKYFIQNILNRYVARRIS